MRAVSGGPEMSLRSRLRGLTDVPVSMHQRVVVVGRSLFSSFSDSLRTALDCPLHRDNNLKGKTFRTTGGRVSHLVKEGCQFSYVKVMEMKNHYYSGGHYGYDQADFNDIDI